MKRGFLAKAYSDNKTEAKKATRATGPTPEQNLETMRLSYGVVNEKLPENYAPRKRQYEERDPSRLDGPSNHLLMTVQPPVPIGATFDEYPDRWTECLVTPAVKKQIVSAQDVPKPIPRPTLIDGKKPYEIKNIPGRGLGVVAARDLQIGDLVISERPILITPRAIRGRVPSADLSLTVEQTKLAIMRDWESVLQMTFDRVRPENQTAFLGLANSHQHDGSGKLLGIIRTNGFAIKDLVDKEYGDENGRYTGTFEDSSRLNHSCCPNTIHTWDAASLSLQFHVVRDIKAGEELTVQYTDLDSSTEDRQRYLLPYGFQCTCSSCSFPDIPEIDRKRAEGTKAAFIDNNEFVEWFRDLSQPDDKYITLGLKELELLRDIEMDIWMGGPLYRITQSCILMGDVEGAMKYGTMLGALNCATQGTKAQDRTCTLKYFKGLPIWGLRAKYKAANTPVPLSSSVPWGEAGGIGVLFLGGGGDDPMDMIKGLLQVAIGAGGDLVANNLMNACDILGDDDWTKKMKEMVTSIRVGQEKNDQD